MTQYKLEGLGFTYEGAPQPILHNITAILPTGQITLLLGESGAGKTTLIEVLTHIIPEYHPGKVSGQFHCGSSAWAELELKQMARQIGLVFQNPESQFCTYTVMDELAFGLENLCVPPQQMETIIHEVLTLLNIQHLKDRPLHSLSGGEKQRVAIASVLTPNPPMLIFDEPTSNLDPESINEIFTLLHQLKIKTGKTILIVEHQLEQLAEKVDHLLVLGQNGSLLFGGPMEQGLQFLLEHSELNVHLPPSIEFFRKLTQKPVKPPLSPLAVAHYIQQVGEGKPDLPSNQSPPPTLGPVICSSRGLSITLGGHTILQDLNIDIYQGDFIAIVGPNGAGKTTLLHSLLGICLGYEGTITLFGKNIKKLRQKKWNYAGIAFQNPEWQFVTNSVIEEILYSLKKTKITLEEKMAIAQKYLEQFGLWEKRDLSPFVLSQGEKRRLSVATILVRRQKLLILDEPTFGQDLRNQNELMSLMQHLNQNGITIIMVSHNMDLVNQYCNRTLLLKNGSILFDGSPQQLFADDTLCKQGRLNTPFWMQVSKALPNAPLLRSFHDAIQRYSLPAKPGS